MMCGATPGGDEALGRARLGRGDGVWSEAGWRMQLGEGAEACAVVLLILCAAGSALFQRRYFFGRGEASDRAGCSRLSSPLC